MPKEQDGAAPKLTSSISGAGITPKKHRVRKKVNEMKLSGALAAILAVGGITMARAYDGPRLAADGKALVTVVTPDDAGPASRAASADLVRCLGRALGAQVPVATQLADAETPVTILVGSAFGVDFGVSAASLQRDGCILKTKGNALLITGVHDEGIANGVYTFLTDHVGARWFAPGELWEVVPSNPNLVLPDLDITTNPDFSYRVYSGAVGDLGTQWRRRNRIDVDTATLPNYGFGHNLGNIISSKVYGKDHPEYFALIDGKRRTEGEGPGAGAQPCFTNPDVVRIASEAAADFFNKNPERTTFSLCTNDNALFCRCPECSKVDEPMRKSRSGWDIHSDSYFHFVEQVAKAVAKSHPGKFVSCYAYWNVELPPRPLGQTQGERRLPDNVVVALTQDTSQHFDADYKKADRDLWLSWSKAAERLGKYDYYGLGWLTPRFFPHLAADDLKFIAANSAVGFYCEIYPNWSVTAPQLYMAARMLWDASLNPDTLLDEYCGSLFGRAAPEMRRFYSILEQYWTKPRRGQWFQGLDNIRPELAMADADLMEQAWQCLFRAKPLVIGVEAQRVADVEDHFKLSYHIVKGYALAQRIARWKITGHEGLARLVADMMSALEIVRIAQRVHRDVWLADPIYQHSYYQGDRFARKFDVWCEEMRKGVAAAVANIRDYCRNRLPHDEATTVLKDLRERLDADETASKWELVE